MFKLQKRVIKFCCCSWEKIPCSFISTMIQKSLCAGLVHMRTPYGLKGNKGHFTKYLWFETKNPLWILSYLFEIFTKCQRVLWEESCKFLKFFKNVNVIEIGLNILCLLLKKLDLFFVMLEWPISNELVSAKNKTKS